MADESVEANSARQDQLIAWLDDQRRDDRDRIERLEHEVERLVAVTTDQASQIARLTKDNENEQTSQLRLDQMAELGRQLREHVSLIEQAIESHFAAGEEADRSRAIEVDRDRRTVTEVSQQTEGLRRALEQVQGRVAAATEEIHRDRQTTITLAPRIESSERATAAMQGRVAQIDELVRRNGQQLAAADGEIDRIKGDVTRVDNSYKLAEIRWTRDFGEMKQRVDAFQARVEEQVKPIVSMMKGVASLADHVKVASERTEALVVDVSRFNATIARLDLRITTGQEQTARNDQRLDEVKRRLEERESQLRQLGDAVVETKSLIDEQSGRIERHDHILAEIASRTSQVEDQRIRIDEVVAQMQMELRRYVREQETLSDLIDQKIASVADAILRDIANARELDLDQRRRLIAELDQQLNEVATRGRNRHEDERK